MLSVSKSRFKTFVVFGTILYCSHYLHLYHMNAFNNVLMRGYDVIEQPIHMQGLTKRFVDESIKVLQHGVRNDTPVLLFVSWHHTHTSLQPMKQFAGKSSHGKYGDCVEEMDWGIGEIMAALDRLNITDNTIVYFTSDHGGHIEEMVDSNWGYNGIYRGGKFWGATEGSVRVPGLIKWPGKLPVNHVIPEPTSLMDILPTLSDIMGVPLQTDRPIDGRNIMPILTRKSSVSPHELLMHYCGSDLQAVTYIPRKEKTVWKIAFKFPDTNIDTSQCIKFPPYINHLCSCSFSKPYNPPLLFDLTSDPRETTPIDINSGDNYKDIIQKVKHAVEVHVTSLGTIDTSSLSGSKAVWYPHLQLCCNFPLCFCSEEN